jgi:hypothetical protein
MSILVVFSSTQGAVFLGLFVSSISLYFCVVDSMDVRLAISLVSFLLVIRLSCLVIL